MDDEKYTSVSISGTNDNFEENIETDAYPMSESLFKQLSTVIGFNDMNGKTYKECVENWKLRKQIK
tara:strand:+ start:748 stop:945 length:198 start_codon:yes stop_codon:yes gene_type:complete